MSAKLKHLLYFSIYLLLPVANPCFGYATSANESLSYAEDLLYKKLFENYEKNSIAKQLDGRPVEVKVRFTLIQLLNLDEKSQVLTTAGWMEVLFKQNSFPVNIHAIGTTAIIQFTQGCIGVMTWLDHRLTYDIMKHPKKSLVVPPDKVWLPDIGLQNSARDIYHSSLVNDKFRVNIYPNGTLLWIPGGNYFTNCEMDIKYFPFDDQVCILHFTNWAYNGDEMNLTVRDPHIALDNYQVNGEWDILYTTAHREDKYYACCGDTPYPSIFFTIHMRRKFLFYVTNILAPCVMLSVLVCMVFYLPPEAGEKIPLGITILLSFTIFLLLIAESIPKRSDAVPIISVYLTTFLAITTASICSTIVVLHVHQTEGSRVPKWLKRFVFDCLGRALCLSHLVEIYGAKADRDEFPLSSTKVSLNSSHPAHLAKSLGSIKESNSPVVQAKRHSDHNKLESPGRASFSPDGDIVITPTSNNAGWSSSIEEILLHIRLLTAERNAKDYKQFRRREWIAVATVLDRFFMVLFIFSISLSSGLILYLLPTFKLADSP